MGIEFKQGMPKILKIYQKAITGDHDAIKYMSDYYDKKQKPKKALEWFIFGAQNGYIDFMKLICLQIIVIYNNFSDKDKEKLLILGLYWANKYKEHCINNDDVDLSNNIITALQKILAKHSYNTLLNSINLQKSHIPKL